MISHSWLLKTSAGALVSSFAENMGHIVSLRWNQMGDSLLSCGSEKVLVWDMNTVGSRQEFNFHSGIHCNLVLHLFHSVT